MLKSLSMSLFVIVVMTLFCWAPDAGAYPTYDGCANCHGGFRDKPYIASSDFQTWTNGLHDVHKDMLNGDCDTCHSGSSRKPVYINTSTGGEGLDNISCIGCHGRAEDGSGTNNTWRYGAGLIQKHSSSGVCSGCHADSDPSNPNYIPPVGEDVLPPYYANPGINHPAISADPCNSDASEDFAGTIIGLDNDGDGYYDGEDSDCVFVPFCTDADGDSFNAEGGNCGPADCDDNDFLINPDATEICGNGIDENCDNVDAICPFDCTDYDNDGYGVGADCLGPDCNDNDASVNPMAAEKCDEIDNDCNGVIDDGFDADNDGYTVCSGDCDEGNPSINPGAAEVCDGKDNNCNGSIDETFTDLGSQCIAGQGQCQTSGTVVCKPDFSGTECNATPGTPATEVCDGLDNNCDGIIDDGFDADNDGYTVCNGDCDESNPSVHPGADEICGNGIDENCDTVDDICPLADVMLNNLNAPKTLRVGNRTVSKRIVAFGSADMKVQEAAVKLSIARTDALTVTIYPESLSMSVPIDGRHARYLFYADIQCTASGEYSIEWNAAISASENRELNNDTATAATTVICR